MPVVVAALIRAVIQAGVTLGIWSFAEKALDWMIKTTMKLLGATEEQATDIFANGWIQAAEDVGLLAATIKTKIPTKIAERLGFTSKGFVRRSSIVSVNATNMAAKLGKTATAAQKAVMIAEAAPAIAAKGKTTLQNASNIATLIIAGLGVPVGVGILVTNTIDFAAWSSSAYQGTFQKLLAIFGIEPDKDYIKSKVLSDDMSKKILAVYTENGATTIKDPRTDEVLPFNRDNFIKIADFIAAQIVMENGEVKTKEMLAAMTALVGFGNKPTTGLISPALLGGGNALTASDVKIFSGIISQGKLGVGIEFVQRENDIIESVAELQDAAQNNLASYLTNLPSRLIYELKLVNSVMTKDGYTLQGTTQRVIYRYNSKGEPLYKNLTNKFAVLNLYALTLQGKRSKIASINLGPTDAVKLKPTSGTLTQLGGDIAGSIVTTDINAIKSLETSSPITITPPPVAPTATPIITASAPVAGKIEYRKRMLGTGSVLLQRKDPADGAWRDIGTFAANDPAIDRIINGQTNEPTKSVASPAPAPVAVSTQKQYQNAANLSEFYAAIGEPLPSIPLRGIAYQTAGLGLAPLYVGSAEQNTKLLTWLKANPDFA